MAKARPPLALLGTLGRPTTQEEVGYRQIYDSTYGDPTAPQPGMYMPKVESWGALYNELHSDPGLRGKPTQATPMEYGDQYREWANAQRSALAALGYDAKRVTPPPDYDRPVSAFPYLGAYTPQSDQMFVDPRGGGTTGSHEGMHRAIYKLREAGLMPPTPGLASKGGVDIDDDETLVRAMVAKNYGPQAEGYTETGGGDAGEQIRRGLQWLAQNPDFHRQIEAAAAQQIAKQRPRGPR